MSSQPGRSNPQLQQAQQMFNSLSQGRKVTLVAAVVGLIFSFFKWYGGSYSTPGASGSIYSQTGWHSWGVIAVLLFIAAGALVVLPLLGISVRNMVNGLPPSVTDGVLIMGAGIVAAIAILLFMLTGGTGLSGPGYSEGPSFGAFVGLICAVAIAAGGYLTKNEMSTR